MAIAEFGDSEAIFALMLTCRVSPTTPLSIQSNTVPDLVDVKSFYSILSTYQHTVVKRKVEDYRHNIMQPQSPRERQSDDNTALGNIPHDLYAAPHGTVLTTTTPLRTVATPYSYAVLRELEVREQCIQRLLRSEGFFGTYVKGFQLSDKELSPDMESHLLDGFQRACRLADRLGDCAASVVARSGWIDGYNAHIKLCTPQCRCRSWVSSLEKVSTYCSNNRSYAFPHTDNQEAAALTSKIKRERNEDMVVAKLNYAIRSAQIAFVRHLPALDLTYLAILSEFIGSTYRMSISVDMSLADTAYWEKITAYQESALRQGASLALWAVSGVGSNVSLKGKAHSLKDMLRSRSLEPLAQTDSWQYMQQSVTMVLKELFDWEIGYGMDRISVEDVFRPDDDESLISLSKAIDNAVKGDIRDVGCSKFEDYDEDQDGTVPRMQAGLHMTMLGTLFRERDLTELTEIEKEFVRSMYPGHYVD